MFRMLKYFLSPAIVLTMISCNDANEKTVEKTATIDGKQLFKINCAQCHRANQDLTGPALKGVEARWSDKALLYEFVQNPSDVIRKDKYAADLFAKWKQAYMQPFPNLSNDDIQAIFDYCNSKEAE